MNARAAAARVILEVAYRGASLDAAIAGHMASVDEDQGALFRELSYGAVRWYWRCKGVVDCLVDRPLRRPHHIVEALMIVGVYQLDQLRLPSHAAIHTTVEACTGLERSGFKGLVNGVLRNFQRRRSELLEMLPKHELDAHPGWLWEAIEEQWPQQARAIVEANNSRPPMTLRVNIRLIPPARYVQVLKAEGLEGRALDGVPAAVILASPVEVGRLPGFARGWVSVQDASAQLLAGLVSPRPGDRLLDACAAPGGKLTHLLETFPGVKAQAVEVDGGRATRITENLRRLRLAADVTVADAAELDAWWDGRPYDLVVLDVPCSGTGVIRRHPDIKVLRRASDIARLAGTQMHLLDRLWTTVKPGGRMIYVTCSILARENQEQIEGLLRRAPNCRAVPASLPFGAALQRGWQVLPGQRGGDGFYYAALVKDAPGPGTSGAGD